MSEDMRNYIYSLKISKLKLPTIEIKGALLMDDINRNVWEGWTPKDFIDAIYDEIDMIMSGNSWRKPFQTRDELTAYIVDNQPYYKKPIEEVNNFFIQKYNL